MTINDIEKKHHQMLWNTVRIRAEKAWGSGTVIYSNKIATEEYVTYILTCHHVIADNIRVEKTFDHRVGYDIKKELRTPVEVEFFYYEGLSKCSGLSGSHKADIVAYNEDVDIALLQVRRSSKVDYVAQLFPKDNINEVHVFDEVYAVGAALAHEPIATKGIINFMNEMMEKGIEYWMSNAQIIFGNSGGSLYRYSEERERYELLGIPARISVSIAGFSPDPITHMGFFIPIPEIYDFFDDNFYQFIYDSTTTYEECQKQREDYRKEKEKLFLAKYGGSPEEEQKGTKARPLK